MIKSGRRTDVSQIYHKGTYPTYKRMKLGSEDLKNFVATKNLKKLFLNMNNLSYFFIQEFLSLYLYSLRLPLDTMQEKVQY